MDPLLSSLCTICHIDPPKYTCPRCSVQTCSLACSKRHKIWSSCNGARDPTVYKPMSQLATPSGIDHDYNFLHSIEHGIERSEKLLIEDLGLVTKKELEIARSGETEEQWRQRNRRHAKEPPGVVCIERALQERSTKIIKAPTGMRRNKENTTSWNRKHKVIHWQVEWLRGAESRTLYKALGSDAVGKVFDAFCEEERKMNLSDKERALEKKRKAAEFREQRAKRARIDSEVHLLALTVLQDTTSTAWNVSPTSFNSEPPLEHSDPEPKHHNYHFYLHRPLTPASFPRVLAPIDASQVLSELLKDREVLEFPTIHVLSQDPRHLPDLYMLEKEYLATTGQSQDADTSMSEDDEDESEDDSPRSSSSGSDSPESSSADSSDEEMDDPADV